MPIWDSPIASRLNTRGRASSGPVSRGRRVECSTREADPQDHLHSECSIWLNPTDNHAQMFGKCRAIRVSAERQTRHASATSVHRTGEGNTVAQICEPHTAQLQDALSRYLPALYKRAYRYVEDPHDAEDAVQDALLSAYKHLDQFKATAKMTTWLTTIVTNSALTQLRIRSRHPHLSLNEN